MNILNVTLEDQIAILSIDQPGSTANRISRGLMTAFRDFLEKTEQDSTIKAVIIRSTKKDSFIAGADIRLFLGFKKPGDALAFSREGSRLLSRLQALPLPVIAAIHGAAHGGGLEVVLACHYRIATDHPSTRFSLPEVTLGLCPAAGGTQRLPALIGNAKALPMMLTGRAITAKEARNVGLVDDLVPESGLIQAAKVVAEKLIPEPSARKKSFFTSRLFGNRDYMDTPGSRDSSEPPFSPRALFTRAAQTVKGRIVDRRPVFKKAKKELQNRTRGLCPAPTGILECVKHGEKLGIEAGLAFESGMFEELAMTPESRQLIHHFMARRSARKNPSRVTPREVRRIGILGAGLMGSGIASVSIRNGFEVTVRDRDITSAVRAKQTVWHDLQELVNRKALLPFERDQMLAGVHLTHNFADFERLPLVIEAVIEDIAVKHAVLKKTESVISDDAIIATNTSAIPIAEIARAARRPERVIGMHYFSPAQKMPLVEIIRGEKTGEDVVATACDVAIRQGKHVIVVGDAPGFYVTRIIVPMINEAMLLVEEGADIRIVDIAAKNFGFPVGPITLTDEAGIDVVSNVMEEMSSIFRKRGSRISQSIHRLHESGYAGKKNLRGFYHYDSRRKRKLINDDVYTFFGSKRRKDFSLNEIMERISLAMINEALYCLQDGVIDQPRTGDIGAVLGMGFPAFRGGPFRYLDTAGPKTIWDRLQYRQDLHGIRFKPAQILGDYVKSNRAFYP